MTAAPRGRCRSGLPPDDIPGRASGQSPTVAEAGRPGSISVWPNQLNLTTPWLEPAGAAADRGHFTGAAWNWHPFAVEHTPAEGTAILLRSRGGTDGSNPLPSSGESANHRFLRRGAKSLATEARFTIARFRVGSSARASGFRARLHQLGEVPAPIGQFVMSGGQELQ
jgi:hypothetical protein